MATADATMLLTTLERQILFDSITQYKKAHCQWSSKECVDKEKAITSLRSKLKKVFPNDMHSSSESR